MPKPVGCVIYNAPFQITQGNAWVTNYPPYEACKIDTIAPHIHVLTRDIPYILYIIALCFYLGNWFACELRV